MEANGGAGIPVGAVACPVCTLYLREGISLQKHLDTHPKEQVIEALIKASAGSSLQQQQQQQQQQQEQQQAITPVPVPAVTTPHTISTSLPMQAVSQTPAIQTSQSSVQVTQNPTTISTHTPYPIGPIFECPSMMPPQFTSFSYQQFVNNGTMMIPAPQYAMAPQANQMMQMLYNPYGMYQQQQIPTVQMISPITAIPGASRIRPVGINVAATESNVRTTLAVSPSSPEPKQILPEILPETEPETEPEIGQVPSVLQNEDASVRRDEGNDSTLQIDHQVQQNTRSTTSVDENTTQHEYNSISRSITITCAINNSDNDKAERVLPDIEDEDETLNDTTTVNLRCKSTTYEQPEVQQFSQQVQEDEYMNVSLPGKKNDMTDDDVMVCENNLEKANDERSASCNSVDSNVTSSQGLIAVDEPKELSQSEFNSVEKLKNLLSIMEMQLNNVSQKENNVQNNQGEKFDTKGKSSVDREESVIHNTVVTIPGSHEKDHILPDIQEPENNSWSPNPYVNNELRRSEKSCHYLSRNTECSKMDDELEKLEKSLHNFYKNNKHSFSAPPSPVTKKKRCKTLCHSARSEFGSRENLGAYHHRAGFDDVTITHDDDDEDEDEDDDMDDDEKSDKEDNFDEADMEIEEIPSPHTPFARYGCDNTDGNTRSHTPLSAISGISVLRVRKDLSKPCSPRSVRSFHHVDSDSISQDEDSNGVDNNVINNTVEKDPIDCSQIDEVKTDEQQQQEMRANICENKNQDKNQEPGSSTALYGHQSVITEHVSSFPVIHSHQSISMHIESRPMTMSIKTQNLLNLSESIRPTTSAESKNFHSSAKSSKQSTELLNINEDAHAGPMNVFEFDGLQILVPSTFISDSSQKAVSATSQQSMASSEGAIGADEEVKSINMRADETMPPRGELSEQESNGCTEPSAWQVCLKRERERGKVSE
jgi:hypothetical protein